MKKVILSILLGAGLILSGPALAVTKRSLMHSTWQIDPAKSKDIYIDYKSDTAIKSDVVMIHLDNMQGISHVQILWNGKVVPHGEDVGPGDTVIFHIEQNGTLTLKNLNDTQQAWGEFYLDN